MVQSNGDASDQSAATLIYCPYEKLPDGRWKCPLCKDIARAYPKPPLRACPRLQTDEGKQLVSERVKTPCVHRGAIARRLVNCHSCPGDTDIKVFGCAIYRECTIGKQLAGIKCCASCGDYEANDQGTSRSGSVDNTLLRDR
jgi:hypothetical protein